MACPVHRLHLKLGPCLRGPAIPLHFVWTQLGQPSHKMEFVATPLRHGTGVFAGLLKHIEPLPRYKDVGFAHVDALSYHVSLPEDQLLLQVLWRFSNDDQVIFIQVFSGNSWERTSRAVMNSRGLGKEP